MKLSSFGSFSIRQKGRRIGRNPRTGEKVPILPRRVLVFRPSQVLRARINNETSRAMAAPTPSVFPTPIRVAADLIADDVNEGIKQDFAW